MIGQKSLELVARILAALIRIMQQSVCLAAPPDGHHQRVHDERGIALRLRRPADDATREQVKDGGDVEPALGCPGIGSLIDPLRSVSLLSASAACKVLSEVAIRRFISAFKAWASRR